MADADVMAIVDEGLGNSSYLVDLGDGGALIIDPERDPRPHLAELARRRLRPRFVVETHLHADFVSGGGELVAGGAELWAPAASELAHPHRPLRDRDEIDMDGLRLRVIATPGHTPEHLSYLLVDGARHLALFSGGTLMAGGVARTDLVSPEQTEPLARAAYRSIRERLFTLPDDLVVYPTHGGGSFCSVGSGTEGSTTIGQEKIANPLLAGGADEETFVRRLLAGYGSYPPYFLELREVNRRGPQVHGAEPAPLPQLTVAEVDAAVAEGAQLVDVRGIDAFAAGHIPQAISIPWRDRFATWLGWLVPLDTPIVFVADETVDRRDLVWAALTVGFEQVRGEVAGGMTGWVDERRPTTRIPLVAAAQGADRRVVDVRQASEFTAGHLPHALHVELGDLTDPAGVPEEPLLVHCEHGERAMTAASLLRRAGRTDVSVLKGTPQQLGDLVIEP